MLAFLQECETAPTRNRPEVQEAMAQVRKQLADLDKTGSSPDQTL